MLIGSVVRQGIRIEFGFSRMIQNIVVARRLQDERVVRPRQIPLHDHFENQRDVGSVTDIHDVFEGVILVHSLDVLLSDILVVMILILFVFGIYGPGYDTGQFIYMQF